MIARQERWDPQEAKAEAYYAVWQAELAKVYQERATRRIRDLAQRLCAVAEGRAAA